MSAPGDVLADRYELQSPLGRGGMAEVFRAHDRRLDREVAVKVLAPHLLSDSRSIDRFDREARAAASLNHPNIVNVYDAVSDGDTHAIVMELVEGGTLDDVIRAEGQMAIADAVPIAISIADALQAAHDRGLVHHDVKPRNVLFDRDGKVKVTDFGIARAASSDITTVQGSPPYLAPEQARGGQSDRRSDIYALGCVLFEMLAGRPPFEGDSSSAVVMQHIDAPIPELSRLRQDVPRDLESIVTRALAKDPDQRYDSPAAMRADLTRIAGGLSPVGATIVSSTHAMPQDATRPLDDDWDDAPAEYTRDYDEEPRRRGVSARAIAITLAVVLLLVILALAWADNRGRETAEAGPVVTEAPTPQDDNADQADQQSGDDSNAINRQVNRLNRAARRIRRLIRQGRDADQATLDRIEELRRQVQETLDDRDNDGTTSASEDGRLDELRRQIDELTRSDQDQNSVLDRIQQFLDSVNPFSDS